MKTGFGVLVLADGISAQRRPSTDQISFVTVPHRCFRPTIDETCKGVGVECFRVEGIEVGMRLVRISPCNSRTRNPLSTPDCRHGRFTAPEHAF
jgi:hypothetical protein